MGKVANREYARVGNSFTSNASANFLHVCTYHEAVALQPITGRFHDS